MTADMALAFDIYHAEAAVCEIAKHRDELTEQDKETLRQIAAILARIVGDAQ